MAVMLTIEGTYKVQSSVAGKSDLKDFKLQKPWPIEMDAEDFDEMQVANFYVKNFMLETWLRGDKEISKEYRGFHECAVEHVRLLDNEEIEEFVGSGELLAIDPYDFSAADIDKMKRTALILSFVMMDGDQTPYVARTKTIWQGRDVVEQRSYLKVRLGLEDEVEKVQAKTKSVHLSF